MNSFFHVLALSGAFFVSFSYAEVLYDPNDLKPPKEGGSYCIDGSLGNYEATGCGETEDEARGQSCAALAPLIPPQPPYGQYTYHARTCVYARDRWRIASPFTRCYDEGNCVSSDGEGSAQSINFGNLQREVYQSCPPDQFPLYEIPVVVGQNDEGEDQIMCAKLNDNPDSCPTLSSGQAGALVFNDGSFPSDICYDVNGEVCRYPVPEQGSTFTHPAGIGTGYDCSTNEPVDSVPDSEQDPDDPDCQSFDVQGQNIYCHEDMDDRCSLQGDDYFCDEGCGFVNNVFMCPKPDSNISDPLDCTDPEYAQVNPEVCSNDPSNPDSNGDGVLDNQDIAQGVSNLTSAQNTTNELLGNMNRDINNNLDGIGTKLDSLKNKQDQANFQLGAIEDNTNRTADSVESIEDFITKEPDIREPNYGGSESMWESEYPDGIAGIWNEKRGAFMQTGAFQFLSQFTLSGTGGDAPDMQICFNMPPVASYGCKDFGDFSYIWAFIKMCILITAAWLCRSLIFGG